MILSIKVLNRMQIAMEYSHGEELPDSDSAELYN